ncbi:MAG: hypothetical protein K8I82_03955 [Anaerolineae bacterium]|nr:hypothetical protein [Anaerolineae bacterium]
MIYNIHFLTDQLVYIKWNGIPTMEQGLQFLQEFQSILDQAHHPLYFLSDLREGHIKNTHLIRRLSAFNEHPNFGGGTGFSDNPCMQATLRLWTQFSSVQDRISHIWPRSCDAVEYLETLRPGLTKNLNWEGILN